MTVVLLVRRAHTDHAFRSVAGRAAGVGLSEEGREAAARLGERVAPLPLSVVYTSPLERATETAHGMVGERALPIVTREDFNEVDFGDWTGRSLAELESDRGWREFDLRRATTRVPRGETMEQVRARTVRAIERLAAEHPRSLVAVVTHAEPIRAAVLHYLGARFDPLRLAISPASVTAVAVGRRGPRVLCVNETGRLGAVAAAP